MIRLISARLAVMMLLAFTSWQCSNPKVEATNLSVVPLPDTLMGRQPLNDLSETVKRLLPYAKKKPVLLAQAFGELGNAYHALNYMGLARDCYSNANLLDPQEYRWAYYLGKVQRSLGNFEASDVAFQNVLGLRTEYVPAMVWIAENAFDRGLYEAAEEQYKNASRLDVQCAKCLYGLSMVASAQSRFDSAATFLQMALDLQPQASQLHYNMGLVLRELGDMDRARKHLALAESHPARRVDLVLNDPLMIAIQAVQQDALSLEHMAQKALERGDYQEAIATYRRCLQLDAERPDARFNLAMALLRLGRRELAKQELNILLSHKPDHAPSLVLLGNLSRDESQTDAALVFFQRAVLADPAGPKGDLGMADVFRYSGQYLKALKHYQSAAVIDPADHHAKLGSVISLVLLRQYDQAISKLDACLAAFPGSSLETWLTARLWSTMVASTPSYHLNLTQFLAACSKDGLTVFEMETLAMCYASLEQFSDAIRWQTKARDSAANQPESFESAARRLNDYQQGRTCQEPWNNNEFELVLHSWTNKKGQLN